MSKKHDNIISIYDAENFGVRKASNQGANLATGHYITFLDSDDTYINEKKIENEVNLIKGNNDIAFSQWAPLDIVGNIRPHSFSKRNIYGNRYGICKILSVTRPGYQQLRGYLFTKDLFNKVGGYTFPYNYFEDFDFQCRLALHGNLKYTKEYGEGYRNVPGGLSKQKILDANEIINLIQNKYYRLLHFDQKIYYRFILIRKRIFDSMLHLYSKGRRFIRKIIK